LMTAEGERWTPMAGGTDLMVQYAAGHLRARRLMSIARLAELRRIDVLADEIQIGAGSTYTGLRRDETIAREVPVLAPAGGLGGLHRESESRDDRREHRECVAGGGFAARAAGLWGGIDSGFGAGRAARAVCDVSHRIQKDGAGGGRADPGGVCAAEVRWLR